MPFRRHPCPVPLRKPRLRLGGAVVDTVMTGEAPWWHKEQKELQRKIAHTKLRLPTWFTNEAKTLIRGLLTKDPATRLGVTPDCPNFTSDFAAIQRHPFFRNLNFRMLELCKLEAPFIPSLSSDNPELDVSNFDEKCVRARRLLGSRRAGVFLPSPRALRATIVPWRRCCAAPTRPLSPSPPPLPVYQVHVRSARAFAPP